MPTLLLVRHGHSSANGEGILAGRLPGIHLTDRGREQAQHLGKRFEGVAPVRVVSSPLERCLETAEPLAQAVGLTVEVEDDLQECAYGAWSGRKLAELTKDPLWSTVQDDPTSARFPDHETYAAESLTEMSERVVAAVRRIDAEVAQEHGDKAVWVAVSHGDLVKALLADATGSGLGHFQRYTADPASVSAIRYGGRHTFLLAANELSPDLQRFVPAPDAPATGDAQVGGGAG
ncbi:MSMEG_4193 family putative phosphomutase [Pedococcus sp. KACC 23699]|uniref:MSMEG_4193 family putative phosphomutase n=1 Tax=Pedococcus sp. KACC 23699 TaxID=3149228 RepID=A0AAU7JSS4_9MICO